MEPAGGYRYRAVIPADSLPEGPYEYALTVVRGGRASTFPEGVPRRPWDWDWSGHGFWRLTVVRPGTPLRLFTAGEDVPRLAFSRIGDAVRQGIFRVVSSFATGEPVIQLYMPKVKGYSPEDYTASLLIAERMQARAADAGRATGVRLRARGLVPGQVLHVTVVEKDGTGWSAAVPLDPSWGERTIPLSAFRPAPAVMLPEGYPGEWNYWMPPADGRGGPGDTIHVADVERIEFSLRRADGVQNGPMVPGVEIEWATLVF